MSRILAIDFGTVRIGIALSDSTNTIASPREYIRVKTKEKLFRTIINIVKENDCNRIVIGLPISLTKGQDTQKTKEVRLFAKKLGEFSSIDIILWDERLSSYEAEGILRQMNISQKKRKTKKDSLAAQIILQNYLNSINESSR